MSRESTISLRFVGKLLPAGCVFRKEMSTLFAIRYHDFLLLHTLTMCKHNVAAAILHQPQGKFFSRKPQHAIVHKQQHVVCWAHDVFGKNAKTVIVS